MQKGDTKISTKQSWPPVAWVTFAVIAQRLCAFGVMAFEMKAGKPGRILKNEPTINVAEKQKASAAGWTDQWDVFARLCIDYCPFGIVSHIGMQAGEPIGKVKFEPEIDPSKPTSIPKKMLTEFDLLKKA